MQLDTHPNAPIHSAVSFSWLIFKTNTRNLTALALNLGTPISIIGLYLMGGSGLPAQIVPMLFILSITFNGLTLGTRLLTWRENRMFHRLSVTSTPMSYLIVGLFAAQLILSIGQALVALLVIALAGVTLRFESLLICLYAVLLACFCFTAMGPFLASFVNKAELLLYVYIFFIMPLGFFSFFTQYGGNGEGIASQIASILPMRLMSNLFDTVNQPVSLETIIISGLGLVGYGIAFLWIAGRRYRHFLA